MGLDPTMWGPKAWFFLHSITLNYPDNPTEEQKQKYKTFFESLSDVLPCPGCSEHYKQNINNNPIQLDNKKSLMKWLIGVHNEVNKSIGKKIMEYEDVIKYYRDVYEGQTENTMYIIFSIIVVICIFVFAYLKFKKKI